MPSTKPKGEPRKYIRVLGRVYSPRFVLRKPNRITRHAESTENFLFGFQGNLVRGLVYVDRYVSGIKRAHHALLKPPNAKRLSFVCNLGRWCIQARPLVKTLAHHPIAVIGECQRTFRKRHARYRRDLAHRLALMFFY